MRPAAQLLLAESIALRDVLVATPPEYLDRPTVCTGWSARDVLAHCGAALKATAAGIAHSFTREANERDVEERRSWPLDTVLEELFDSYAGAADAIDRARGLLDGVGLGEWIHGGDVRDAIGAPSAYASAGIDLAVPLLVERSALRAARRIDVTVDGQMFAFGVGRPAGVIETDGETFVRLCGGRQPDAGRYRLEGVVPADFVLFD
jgi:uncharacterized protein (TIGR03083 family)